MGCYAQDRDSPAKRRRSREVIASLAEAGNGVISTQVLQEFYVAVTRRLGVAPLVSFRDALIVAAAAASGCVIVYSEDLNPGQTIQGVRIENPFA